MPSIMFPYCKLLFEVMNTRTFITHIKVTLWERIAYDSSQAIMVCGNWVHPFGSKLRDIFSNQHQFNIRMYGTHTYRVCIPLAPARTQCFGLSSANFENPIFSVGCLSLNNWYKLHRSKRFWTRTLPSACFTEWNIVFLAWHQSADFIILVKLSNVFNFVLV